MSQAPDAPRQPRYRVLLVDDDPFMLRVMTTLLSPTMEVTTCTSGQQAVRLLEQRPFEVVCSDYRMPGMSGIDLLREAARAQEDASCLLVTAAADEMPGGERRQYFVLVKPFDPPRFVRLVEQLGRVSHMKRSVKASATKGPNSERESRPPPSSRAGDPLSDRRAGPPTSSGSPRSSRGGGERK